MKQTKLPEIARISNPSYAAVVSDSLHTNKIAMQARVKGSGSMRCDPSRLYLVLINSPALAARPRSSSAEPYICSSNCIFYTDYMLRLLRRAEHRSCPRLVGVHSPRVYLVGSFYMKARRVQHLLAFVYSLPSDTVRLFSL